MIAGQQLAKRIGGSGAGPMGAAAGIALPMLLPRLARRLGPLGMAAAAVGAWGIQRAMAKPAAIAAPPAPLPERQPVVTPPPIPMVMPADH